MDPPKYCILESNKEGENMQNFDTYEESKFFERLMENGQKIAKAESEKCKDCSYEICSECRIRKEEK